MCVRTVHTVYKSNMKLINIIIKYLINGDALPCIHDLIKH